MSYHIYADTPFRCREMLRAFYLIMIAATDVYCHCRYDMMSAAADTILR